MRVNTQQLYAAHISCASHADNKFAVVCLHTILSVPWGVELTDETLFDCLSISGGWLQAAIQLSQNILARFLICDRETILLIRKCNKLTDFASVDSQKMNSLQMDVKNVAQTVKIIYRHVEDVGRQAEHRKQRRSKTVNLVFLRCRRTKT